MSIFTELSRVGIHPFDEPTAPPVAVRRRSRVERFLAAVVPSRRRRWKEEIARPDDPLGVDRIPGLPLGAEVLVR